MDLSAAALCLFGRWENVLEGVTESDQLSMTWDAAKRHAARSTSDRVETSEEGLGLLRVCVCACVRVCCGGELRAEKSGEGWNH